MKLEHDGFKIVDNDRYECELMCNDDILLTFDVDLFLLKEEDYCPGDDWTPPCTYSAEYKAIIKLINISGYDENDEYLSLEYGEKLIKDYHEDIWCSIADMLDLLIVKAKFVKHENVN